MIRQFFSREKAKLKEMTFAEKRWYIWEYYKLHIILGAAGIAIVSSMIYTTFINPPKNDYLYIAWQAGLAPTEMLDNLGERLSVIVEDPERYQVSVRSYTLGDDPQMNHALITRFHAMLSIGEIHAVLTTEEEAEQFAEFGIIASLDEVLTIVRESKPDLYDAMAERLIAMTFIPDGEEETVTDIMSIHMGGLPIFTELGLISDDIFFGVVINARQPYSIVELLGVFFG